MPYTEPRASPCPYGFGRSEWLACRNEEVAACAAERPRRRPPAADRDRRPRRRKCTAQQHREECSSAGRGRGGARSLRRFHGPEARDRRQRADHECVSARCPANRGAPGLWRASSPTRRRLRQRCRWCDRSRSSAPRPLPLRHRDSRSRRARHRGGATAVADPIRSAREDEPYRPSCTRR